MFMTFIWKTFDLVFRLFHINTRFNVFYLLRQIIRRLKNFLFVFRINSVGFYLIKITYKIIYLPFGMIMTDECIFPLRFLRKKKENLVKFFLYTHFSNKLLENLQSYPLLHK
jgi:GT2 family glycosyltransferase